MHSFRIILCHFDFLVSHFIPSSVSFSLFILNIFLFKFVCIADISKDKWERLTAANNWNTVELRDNRYNQIVHMVSAANGAEEFYSTEVSTQIEKLQANYLYYYYLLCVLLFAPNKGKISPHQITCHI